MSEVAFAVENFDRVVSLLETYATAIGVLVVVLVSTAIFMFGQSLKDVQENASRTLGALIDEKFDKKITEVQESMDSWRRIQEEIERFSERVSFSDQRLSQIDKLTELERSHAIDVSGMAQRIDRMVSRRDLNDEDRKELLDLFGFVLKAGLRRQATGNQLFNLSQDASKAGLEMESLKLVSLAEYLDPGSTHLLSKLRKQSRTGVEFEVIDNGPDSNLMLHPVRADAVKIQDDALETALIVASSAPCPQSEIIYSELWNIAQGLREKGALERALGILTASYDSRLNAPPNEDIFIDTEGARAIQPEVWVGQRGKQVPSYLPIIISRFYAAIGAPGWRASAERYLLEAEKLLESESPLSTWVTPARLQIAELRSLIGKEK